MMPTDTPAERDAVIAAVCAILRTPEDMLVWSRTSARTDPVYPVNPRDCYLHRYLTERGIPVESVTVERVSFSWIRMFFTDIPGLRRVVDTGIGAVQTWPERLQGDLFRCMDLSTRRPRITWDNAHAVLVQVADLYRPGTPLAGVP
jgi:hypothetical protein